MMRHIDQKKIWGNRSSRKPPRVMADPNSIAFGRMNRVYDLVPRWGGRIGAKVESAKAGASGRIYAWLKSEGRVVALDPAGRSTADGQREIRVMGEYAASEIVGFAEGKERVYLTTERRELIAFDLAGHELWRKEIPKNPSRTTYWSPDPGSPVEDNHGRIWLYYDQRLFRFSHDGEQAEEVGYYSSSAVKSLLVDAKDNLYVQGNDAMRVVPDLSKKAIDGRSDYLFLLRGKPFSIEGNQLYRLDFEKDAKEDQKIGLTYWNTDRSSLPPAVSENGQIHLLLRNSSYNIKRGRYVRLDSQGHLLWGKNLPLAIDSNVSPVVTPGGTIYFAGESVSRGRGKTVYPVYAIDPFQNVHTLDLPEAVLGLFRSQGEKVMAIMKDGSVSVFEAKTLQHIAREREEEERDSQTSHSFEGGEFFAR